MKGKTKVRLIEDVMQPCKLKKGMQGYIDGYVQITNAAPRAIVVSGDIIDLVPLFALEVLTMPNPMTEKEVKDYLGEILEGADDIYLTKIVEPKK